MNSSSANHQWLEELVSRTPDDLIIFKLKNHPSVNLHCQIHEY